LPIFSSLLGGNSQAAQQAALTQQQLAAAVAKDSGAVADNTASVIQNALAKTNLTSLSQQLGLTQAQAIEYAAGEADVQQQVAAAYKAKTDALGKTAGVTYSYGKTVAVSNNASQVQLNQLNDAKAALDDVTTSVQKTITANTQQNDALLAAESTWQIFNAEIASGVSQLKLQAEQSYISGQAMNEYLNGLTPGSKAFADAVETGVVAMRQSAVTAQINAQATTDYLLATGPGMQAYTDAVNNQVVALQLSARTAAIQADALNASLPAQGQLSDAALLAAENYQTASSAAGQYTNALNALYGQYGTTSGAQASFTTSLDGLTGSITKGKDAVDRTTEAGAKNFTTFQSVATAAENYAEKLYQQTGNASTATTALQKMAGELDTAATKAGLTKTQVQQLNTELFGVPDVKDIKIQVDTSTAMAEFGALDTAILAEIQKINDTAIKPSIAHSALTSSAAPYTPPASGGPKPNATGGPVQAGVPVIVGDGGRSEVFVPNSDGRIYPSVGAGAQAVAGQGGGVVVHQSFYGTQYPSVEQTADMYRQLTSAIGAAA
jgi:hypothetical protein